jgi:flagellar basal-body rod protein FlgC
MDTIAQNIANANTTRTASGTPYRRKDVIFEERRPAFSEYMNQMGRGSEVGNGVRVAKIIDDPSAFRRTYEPGHPDADASGYVDMPNIEIITEMINMISATRSYEANVTALNNSKSMAMKALEIGK